MCYQSTLHKRKEIQSEIEKKIQIILDYYKTKFGVDTIDQKLASCTSKRKTNRWPFVVFYNLLNLSVNNTFVIFTSVFPN